MIFKFLLLFITQRICNKIRSIQQKLLNYSLCASTSHLSLKFPGKKTLSFSFVIAFIVWTDCNLTLTSFTEWITLHKYILIQILETFYLVCFISSRNLPVSSALRIDIALEFTLSCSCFFQVNILVFLKPFYILSILIPIFQQRCIDTVPRILSKFFFQNKRYVTNVIFVNTAIRNTRPMNFPWLYWYFNKVTDISSLQKVCWAALTSSITHKPTIICNNTT